MVTFIFIFAACSPSKKVNTVSYRPLTGKDWSFRIALCTINIKKYT